MVAPIRNPQCGLRAGLPALVTPAPAEVLARYRHRKTESVRVSSGRGISGRTQPRRHQIRDFSIDDSQPDKGPGHTFLMRRRRKEGESSRGSTG